MTHQLWPVQAEVVRAWNRCKCGNVPTCYSEGFRKTSPNHPWIIYYCEGCKP